MPAAAPGEVTPENQDVVFTPIPQLRTACAQPAALESGKDGHTSGPGAALAAIAMED